VPVAERLLALQQLAGNQAVSQLLRGRPNDVLDISVQRDPPSPANPATAPPQSANTVSGQSNGWSLRGLLDGSQKVRLRVGSHTLFSQHAGRAFDWSTTDKGPGPSATLALGVLPLPAPVGPVAMELEAFASAWAGGNALLDLAVHDVVLEATAADLQRIGLALASTMMGPLVPLAMLATLRLPGEARLVGRAKASVSAGARAGITALANPLVWPVAGFGKGSLGASGDIGAFADFDAPVKVELSMGRLRVVGASLRANARLAAELALTAALSAGIRYGYRPAAIDRELWRSEFRAALGVDIGQGIEGGQYATLTTNQDGTPQVDLERVIVNAKALLEHLFKKRNPANDLFQPFKPGEAPPGQPPAVLNLPAVKAHHLARYRSLLGELHHMPGRERETNQVSKWVDSVRAEMSDDVLERAIDLGLLDEPEDATNPPDRNELFNRARRRDSPVFVPFWSRTRQFATAMGVDHIVEWQVWPVAQVDEPHNFELFDPSSNSSAGSGLAANIAQMRANLPPEWQDKTLVFTGVAAPEGRRGETWSHDEIVAGEHLDAYEHLRDRSRRPSRARRPRT
jgi:hypothetical protein